MQLFGLGKPNDEKKDTKGTSKRKKERQRKDFGKQQMNAM